MAAKPKAKAKAKAKAPEDIKAQNLRFILVLCFVPIIILVLVLGLSYGFVAAVSKELPAADAILHIAKDIMTFIIDLLGALTS